MILDTLETTKNIPAPAISRLCLIYDTCVDLEAQGVAEISSQDLAKRLGTAAHNVRKDISFLGEIGTTGAGYATFLLKDHIGKSLNINRVRKACVVGLGRLGSAVLEYPILAGRGIEIVAGFDSSTNRIETLVAKTPLYPAHEITDIVKRKEIEIGIIAVPAESAQTTADALIAGGILGILSFAPGAIDAGSSGVAVRTINLVNELRIVSALMGTNAAAGSDQQK
jgi:redox-sensing transcriptional repressor